MGWLRFRSAAQCAVLCALAMAVACAADGGDPLKTSEDGASGVGSASGVSGSVGNDGSSYGGSDSTVGSSSGSGSSGSGSGSASGSSGSDASGPSDDGGDAGTPPLVDGAACLMDAGSCAVCATQNAGDMPNCMRYLTCYETNGCNPHTACGAMDAVCGVNTIGGGNAPQTAAIATYDCACH